MLTLPNGITVEYGYDPASQLTGLTYKLGGNTLGNLTYTYDAVGNRVSIGGSWARTGLPAALASAAYDASNQIATWAGTSFTYDANGNLTNDGTKTYGWNARNQLTALSGGAAASFQYDGLGRRRARTASGTTTGFLYDGLNTVQEFNGGTPSANLVPGLTVDEWLTRTDAAGARHFLPDALGSSIALTDGTGAVQTSYTYEPFGQTSISGSTSTSAFQFTGRENDQTGLYYYRARYLNPVLNRFVSEDPIGFNGGDANLYSYVSNNPLRFTDPEGQIAIPVVPVAVCLIFVFIGEYVIPTVRCLTGRCPEELEPSPPHVEEPPYILPDARRDPRPPWERGPWSPRPPRGPRLPRVPQPQPEPPGMPKR